MQTGVAQCLRSTAAIVDAKLFKSSGVALGISIASSLTVRLAFKFICKLLKDLVIQDLGYSNL